MEAESGWTISGWAAALSATGLIAAFWGIGAWVFGWGFRVRTVEQQIEQMSGTHDAVTELGVKMDNVEKGLDEIRKQIIVCQARGGMGSPPLGPSGG